MLLKLHVLFVKIGCLLQTPLLLAIRLYWGYQFFLTGKAKLMNVDSFAGHFHDWGIPYPRFNVMAAGTTECIGGILLLVGLCSRFATLALIGVMCVAYATADKEALHSIFSDPDKFVTADPFLFLYAAVIVFCFGPGKVAVDTFLFKDKSAA